MGIAVWRMGCWRLGRLEGWLVYRHLSAGMPVFVELLDQLAELIGEAVHGALEAGQEVERDDNGEAYAGDGREEVLFHGASTRFGW